MVFGLAADDERRTGLIDQDRVHLVDDGVIQRPLNPVVGLIDHVVAQVVKTVLVVGAVGDVRVVSGLLVFTWQLRQVDAHRQAQEVVKLAHPLRIAGSQVIVHSDHVNTLASNRIQIRRQGRGQRFALTRAHLRNLPVVQGNTAGQLHIKVTHLHDPLGAFANHGKRLRQQSVQGFTSRTALTEVLRFGPQLVIAQTLQSSLQRIDALHRFAILLEQAVVATAENFGEEWDGHVD